MAVGTEWIPTFFEAAAADGTNASMNAPVASSVEQDAVGAALATYNSPSTVQTLARVRARRRAAGTNASRTRRFPRLSARPVGKWVRDVVAVVAEPSRRSTLRAQCLRPQTRPRRAGGCIVFQHLVCRRDGYSRGATELDAVDEAQSSLPG